MQKVLKIVVPSSILLFLIWTIIGQWSVIYGQIVSANYLLILLSLLVLSFTYFGGAYFWYKILLTVSFKTSFKEAFRVFIISNFGRFIPGVVLHYIARVYLTKGLGLGVGEGLSAVFLEAYYTLAGGVLVSVLALPIAGKYINSIWLLLLFIVIFILLILVRPGKVFFWLGKIPYLEKRFPKIIYKGNLGEHLSLLGLSAVLFILYGIGFFLLSSAFIDNPLNRILDMTGLLAAAWVLGFLTPVAPGGLGISDFSFAFLLTSYYNFSQASFFALVFRFNLFLAELLMFLLVIKMFGFDVISSFKKK